MLFTRDPTFHTMAKVTGPLFGQDASGIFGKTIDFTQDGNARLEKHRAPKRSAGVATSRAIMSAINNTSKMIGDGRRQELEAIVSDPFNWASAISSATIGQERSAWLTDDVLWSLLDQDAQNSWEAEAITMAIRATSIADVNGTLHEVTRGASLFHVACGVNRYQLPTKPTTPDAYNANAWRVYLCEGWPPLPTNAITWAGEAITFAGEVITYGG